MAVDGYMYFEDYDGKLLKSESQVDTSANKGGIWDDSKNFKWKDAANKVDGKYSSLFEIEDFSFDIEQTLNIGSQSTGAGAGKVTFNPFQINRKIDVSSASFFAKACSGTPFMNVALGLRKSSGGDTSGQMFLAFKFKLVAVKTVSWSYDDESPKESVTFEYGGLQVFYSPQNPDGTMAAVQMDGWNRVRNLRDQTETPIK